MSRTDHHYTDISHFRAPYENWISLGAVPPGGRTMPRNYISGGSNVPGIGYGYGAAAAPLPPEQAAMVVVLPGGALQLKPELEALLMAQLAAHVIVVVGNDDSVKLAIPMPQGEVREFADKWVARKVAEGKYVLAGSTTGVAGLALPTGTVDKLLMAVKTSPEVIAATSQGQFAILGSLPKKASMLGPIGMAVAVLAGAGIVYWLAFGKKTKKGHAAAA